MAPEALETFLEPRRPPAIASVPVAASTFPDSPTSPVSSAYYRDCNPAEPWPVGKDDARLWTTSEEIVAKVG
jgi:hypothetical protein